MSDTAQLVSAVLILLAVVIAGLLVACYLKLSSILEWTSSVGKTVGEFIYDYRLIHELDKAKKIRMEVMVDEDFAEWQRKHPERTDV